MSSEQSQTVTQLLHAAGNGDPSAVNRLWAKVMDDLRKLAKAQLAREGAACRLETTSLVNQAYMRLTNGEPVDWSNRRHFYGAAANAMRRILIDRARERNRLKRGGGIQPGALVADPADESSDPMDSLALHEAIEQLAQEDPRRVEVVNLRFYAGLSVDETAAAMDVSPRTIDAEWRFARAWLHKRLGTGEDSAAAGVLP